MERAQSEHKGAIHCVLVIKVKKVLVDLTLIVTEKEGEQKAHW